MREAVQAIRISEEGDKYSEAGLLLRGTRKYEEALTHFADAYCIQSRLALRLSEMGRDAEAEAHYQRAYELMPESFGRMESHCFGCEGAFRGQRAQGMAEKVFARLAVETPQKAQVHYLLGYLREQQQRYADALPLYRKTVSLDADYLNAWKHLEELREHIALPIADRNAATLNLLRLDPQGRHGSPALEEVGDLKGLWNGVARAAEFQAPIPERLFPLTASKAAMEKPDEQKSQHTMRNRDYEISYRYLGPGEPRRESRRLTPAKAFRQQRAVAALINLLEQTAATGARP
jgi:tetratricopeptide (TPR) repeat protein